MSNWHRKYTKRHLSKRLFFHRNKHYTYKKYYNILKVVIVILLIFLVYSNLDKIRDIYGNFVKESLDEGDTKIQDKGEGIIEKVKDTVTRDEVDYSVIESEIFRLVNEERTRNGARSLISNTNLNDWSKKHSEKMITQNFFEHSNYNVGENIGETPIHYDVIGCGSTYTNKAIAECFVTGWIGSPGHHTNMINKEYRITGIGVFCDYSKCRATQMFNF